MIETVNLSKRYGATVAVDRVTTTVPPGSVVGVLGPNGAGKSTLLRLLLGLAHPTGGQGTVLGHDIQRDSLAIRRAVGFVPESKSIYRGITVGAFLECHGGVFASRPRPDNAPLARWAIDPRRRADTLSRGERTRLLVAAALARRPRMLVLDEPSDGLDPGGAEDLWAALLSHVAEQDDGGVLLCTHRLEDVERACDRILVLHRGAVVLAGALDDVRARWRRILLRLHDAASTDVPPGLARVAVRHGVLEATTAAWEDSVPAQLATHGDLIDVQPMPLREIYLTLVPRHD